MAIFGPGTIGLLVALNALCIGAKVIIIGTIKDMDKLKIAKEKDAITYISEDTRSMVNEVVHLNQNQGIDFVFECSGAGEGVVNNGIRMLKREGHFIIVSLHKAGSLAIDTFNMVVSNEITISGAYGSRAWGWDRILKLMSTKQLELSALITHKFPIENWKEAFQMVESGVPIKVLLQL